jgi:hypothetical protein
MKIFVLLSILLTISYQEEIDPSEKSSYDEDKLPENYIEDFELSEFESFCKDKKYVVAFFYQSNCSKIECLNRKKKYIKLAYKHRRNEILFISIPINNLQEFNQVSSFQIDSLPYFIMSSFGWKKTFGDTDIKHLGIWVKEIYNSVPMYIEKMSEIENIDKHYFIYYDKEDLETEDFDVILLSKLVHPLTIYYGIPPSSTEKQYLAMKKSSNNTKFFSYRASDNKSFIPSESLDLYDSASFFRNNEFPKNCKINKQTMVYITHYKLPTVIYFGTSPEKSKYFKTFDKLRQKYEKYLMFCVFDYKDLNKKNGKDFRFYANILAGGIPKDKPGMLRIISYDETLNRYKNFHDHGLKSSELFIKNYLQGNLKTFYADQDLGPTNMRIRRDNLRRINKTKFEEITKHKMDTHLVYVYSSLTKDYKKHIDVLQKLHFALGTNRRLKFNILNHDKNDLDGNVHEDLPYLFISNHMFHRKLYEGDIDFRDIFRFLAENLPWLNMNPEFVKDMARRKASLINRDQDI